ncbi:MAG: homogentisate 1,2-dioxygenase, partial [Bacteroidia bacterium]|nr:homogentisate 1,2-dioxygenase [Bacteroidia bacterium]
MPIYHKLGHIPPKRHTVFKSTSGNFYYEQLFGTEGFSGMSSLLYHIHRPTQIKKITRSYPLNYEIAIKNNIKPLLLTTFQVPPKDDYLESRTPLLMNNDCIIGVAAPKKSLTEYFYKNADADEMLFIHKGKGILKTFMGEIPFEYGDYLIIPR